jgi:hypothetical protein
MSMRGGPEDPRWTQAFSCDGGTTWKPNWIMELTRDADLGAKWERRPVMTATNPAQRPSDGVIDLRQYTLKPGKRDTLIDLFERKLVEAQEQVLRQSTQLKVCEFQLTWAATGCCTTFPAAGPGTCDQRPAAAH